MSHITDRRCQWSRAASVAFGVGASVLSEYPPLRRLRYRQVTWPRQLRLQSHHRCPSGTQKDYQRDSEGRERPARDHDVANRDKPKAAAVAVSDYEGLSGLVTWALEIGFDLCQKGTADTCAATDTAIWRTNGVSTHL